MELAIYVTTVVVIGLAIVFALGYLMDKSVN